MPVGRSILNAVEQIVIRVLNLLSKGLGRTVRTFLRASGSIIDKIFEAFAWPFTGTFLLALITTAIIQSAERLKGPTAQLLAAQTGGKIVPDQLIGAQGIEFFSKAAQGVGAFFFENLLDVFEVKGPITPEVGRANAQKFIGLNVLININSWLTRMFADVLSLGKFESIGGLPLQISWALGLGWLTWVIMGPPLTLLIADPLTEGFNRKYTPNKLNLAQILDLYTEGLKDKTWFKDQMLSLGFDEETAFLLFEGRRKKFTRTQLKRFWERQLIDEDELRKHIKREGWTDEELDLIIEEFKNERSFELTEDIAKEALLLFQNGQLPESSTESLLKDAGWSSKEIRLAIQLGKLRKLRTDLTPSQLLNLMSDGLLTQSQVLTRLQNKGYDTSDAQLLIQQEILSRKPKPKPAPPPKEVGLTQAQILAAFRQGVINIEETRKRLKDLGLKDEDINILIELNTPTTT